MEWRQGLIFRIDSLDSECSILETVNSFIIVTTKLVDLSTSRSECKHVVPWQTKTFTDQLHEWP